MDCLFHHTQYIPSWPKVLNSNWPFQKIKIFKKKNIPSCAKPKIPFRTALKISALLKYLHVLPTRVLEIGAAPGNMTRYLLSFVDSICVITMRSRLSIDLNPKQIRQYQELLKSPKITFPNTDGNFFCNECMQSISDDWDLVLCDIGFEINYDHDTFDYFELVYRLMMRFSCPIICKVQRMVYSLSIGLDKFAHILNTAHQTNRIVDFIKPPGSWMGNDEIYLLITRFNKKSQQQALNNLDKIIREMSNFRKHI